MSRITLAMAGMAVLVATPALADGGPFGQRCGIPGATVAAVQSQLSTVVAEANGGLFSPNRMWSAVVDRKGMLCSVISIGDAWPGSRAIAIAKAGSANDFSNSALSISTANLYAPTQPGGSLYGLNNSNPFNPFLLPQGTGVGFVPGGIITFGGGMALYDNGQVIGGLGVSGDTSCTDHVIAYRMRRAAGLDHTPGGPNSSGTDNIEYPAVTGAPVAGFQQPHCLPSDIPPGQI